MQEFLKADIFFFVTTLVVALVGIGLVVILVYVIRILNDVKIFSRKAKDEGEKILDDVKTFRENVEGQGSGIARFLGSLLGFGGIKKKAKKKDIEM